MLCYLLKNKWNIGAIKTLYNSYTKLWKSNKIGMFLKKNIKNEFSLKIKIRQKIYFKGSYEKINDKV